MKPIKGSVEWRKRAIEWMGCVAYHVYVLVYEVDELLACHAVPEEQEIYRQGSFTEPKWTVVEKTLMHDKSRWCYLC